MLSTAERGRLDDIDRHVGNRVRFRRLEVGLSQMRLGAEVGVTYQQLHKYETGRNRISAGRLYATAQALGVSPAYFYIGLEGVTSVDERGVELAEKVVSIKNPQVRRAVVQTVRALASHD